MADTLLFSSVKPTVLTASITSTATTIYVKECEDRAGNTLTMATGFGSVGYGVIEPETDREEHFSFTTITAGTGSFTLTGVTRGLAMIASYGETTAYKKAHSAGVKIILMSNTPALYNQLVAKGNDETITGIHTFTASPVVPTPTTDYQAAPKKYADDLTYAGAPDSDEATKGVVECATSTEVAAGDDVGTTTGPTVVRPSKLAEVIQKGSYLYILAVEAAANTYTGTHVPAIGALTTGMRLTVKFPTAVTGAATYNPNALGAKSIKKYVAGAIADPVTGDIVANQPVDLEYDGTNFVMMSPGATTLTTAIATEATTFFGATDITGAEAETLTAGIGTPITTLHSHKRASIVGTRDMNADSGAVNYAHGLGVTPNWVKITALLWTGIETSTSRSIGVWDGDYACVAEITTVGPAYASRTATNKIVDIQIVVAGNDYSQNATVALDATNVVLTWTADKANAGNISLLIECGV